jgi:hypothetical protein
MSHERYEPNPSAHSKADLTATWRTNADNRENSQLSEETTFSGSETGQQPENPFSSTVLRVAWMLLHFLDE